jgi:hypothetical protein
LQKIQDGGEIRVGRKSLFYLKNSKSGIFHKVLPRFVEDRVWKSFEMAVQSKMTDFLLFIFKNLAKINEQIFFYSVKWFWLKNTHFLEKKIIGEKIKMAAKNQGGVRWTIFSTEI